MEYTIGEFSSMIGVTPDTLRLYEKYGIITPAKDENNNYRYYNDLDVRNLLTSRWYRSLNIPLNEVATLTTEADINEIRRELSISQNKLQDEVERGIKLLNKMKEINNTINDLEESLYICKEEQLPNFYRIRQTDNNNLLNDPSVKKVVYDWMELLPFTYYSLRIPKSVIEDDYNEFKCNWGLAIEEREFHQFNLEHEENIEFIEGGHCVTSVVKTSHKDKFSKKSLSFMTDYIGSKGYSICNDAIGNLIITENKDECRVSYIKICIPVNK